MLSAVILTVAEQDSLIGLSSAISSIGDIGPALEPAIGPLGSYAHLRDISKLILILNMLVGRLEIIPFLVLFHKDFWSIKK